MGRRAGIFVLAVGAWSLLPSCGRTDLVPSRTSSTSSVAEGSCADPSVAVGPEIASGKRLVATYWQFDGVRAFRRFFDTARNEECVFQSLAGGDGKHYCLPTNGRWGFDDSCGAAAIPCARAYQVVDPDNACVAHERVIAKAPLDAGHGFFRWIRGACTPVDDAPALDTEVPLSSFVSATEVKERGAGRVGGLSLVAEDGARLRTSGWDWKRCEPVSTDAVMGTNPPDPRWYPIRVAFEWDGNACTPPSATKEAHNAVCPLTAVVHFDASGVVSYRDIGEPVTVRNVAADGACVDVTDTFGFQLGAPLPAAAFAPARYAEEGTGRIRRRLLTDDHGAPLLADPGGAAFVDTRVGAPCIPTLLVDGSVRCLPPRASDVSTFADAACNEPAIVWRKNDGDVPPFVSDGGSVGSRCDEASAPTIYAVGAPLTQASVYCGGGGGSPCKPCPYEAASFEFRRLERSVPLDTFASGEIIFQ